MKKKNNEEMQADIIVAEGEHREKLLQRLMEYDDYTDEEWTDMRRHMYRHARPLWNKDMDIFKHNVRMETYLHLGYNPKDILH
tara:strand:- start:18 stop:266 length:249 start_codon:yes stop_codon:yes gene_type:complete